MTTIHNMEDQTRKNFASRLRHLRSLRYKTASEFARLLGIDPQRYMTWENAKAEPSLAWLLRVCQLLGCTPDFLLLGFNVPAPDIVQANPEKLPQPKPAKRKQKRNGTH